MAGGILRRWGLGVELVVETGRAVARLTSARRTVTALRGAVRGLGGALSGAVGLLQQLGTVAVPLGAGMGFLAARGSKLAASLEGQSVAFNVLVGSASKAADLMARLRTFAAETPFQEGDILEGSKRLLRITRDNVAQNESLLKLMGQLTAINPSKNIVEAVEALLDASSGGGFERLKEFGFSFKMEDFKAAGRPGGAAFAKAVEDEIRKKLVEMTGDVDLIGMLSATFSGRLSTLKDAVDNTLKAVGQTLNTRLKPVVEALTDRINSTRAAVERATEMIANRWERMAGRVRPVVDDLLARWDALGTEGQARLMSIAAAVVSVIGVLAPLGLAAGVVAFALGSLVSIAGPLASVLSPGIILPLAQALAVVGAAGATFFALFRDEGEGPLEFLRSIATTTGGLLVGAFSAVRAAWGAFASTFLPELGTAIPEALATVRGPLLALMEQLRHMLALIMGEGMNLDAWRMVGLVLGKVVGGAVKGLAKALRIMIALADVGRTVFGPLIVAASRFVRTLIGIVSGSITVREAVNDMIASIAGVMLAGFAGIASGLLGFVELALRIARETVAAIPGASKLLEGKDFGADNVAKARRGISDGIADTIAGIDKASASRAEARAGSVSIDPTFNVPAPEVKVESTVCIDGEEIARSVGDSSDRSGNRQGRPLPAKTRGRVLRGDGVLRPLGAVEAMDTL